MSRGVRCQLPAVRRRRRAGLVLVYIRLLGLPRPQSSSPVLPSPFTSPVSGSAMSLVRALVVASVAISVVSAAAVSKLPKDFKRCKKHDPKLNECLKEAIQQAMVSLIKGAPSLGVLTIDPLHLDRLLIDQGSGPVAINLDFKDLDVTGLGSIKIEKVNADWDKFFLEMDASFPVPIVLDGHYKIGGKVLILPIAGEGRSNLTFENVKAKFTLKGKSMKRGGQEYMDVDRFIMEFTTTRLHIKLDNLFNGDKALGDNMNVFLNENWADILKELKPVIEEALGQVLQAISNRVFHTVPFNQITSD